MRSKEFSVDGQTVRYSPLNVVQVEHYIDTKPSDTKLLHKAVTQWTLEMICDSLNNASGATNGDRWTPERVLSEMDAEYIRDLQTKIMEYSKLEFRAGESQAPSEALNAGAKAQSA